MDVWNNATQVMILKPLGEGFPMARIDAVVYRIALEDNRVHVFLEKGPIVSSEDPGMLMICRVSFATKHKVTIVYDEASAKPYKILTAQIWFGTFDAGRVRWIEYPVTNEEDKRLQAQVTPTEDPKQQYTGGTTDPRIYDLLETAACTNAIITNVKVEGGTITILGLSHAGS